jgi:carboxyl-terminal processing protease
VTDLDFLVGRMIAKPLTFGYTRAKNGNGRLDYTPWAPAIVTPQAGAAGISLPIYILADNFSVSMSELTTMAIKTLPNGKFVGETTWGANGPLAPGVYFNGGQFTSGTLLQMFVYTSSTMFKYLNGDIYEGKGVPPDYPVPDNLPVLQSGHDLPLEKAISLVGE